MERFSATHLREYLGIIRDVIAQGQSMGIFRKTLNPTLAAKLLFGMLDEMATNWILSRRRNLPDRRRRRHRRSVRSRDRNGAGVKHIHSAAVLGRAGTMGAQIAAHLANAGVPTLLLDVTAEAAAQGWRARGRSSRIRFIPGTPPRSFEPAVSTICPACGDATG